MNENSDAAGRLLAKALAVRTRARARLQRMVYFYLRLALTCLGAALVDGWFFSRVHVPFIRNCGYILLLAFAVVIISLLGTAYKFHRLARRPFVRRPQVG
jgi:hypothetical protein